MNPEQSQSQLSPEEAKASLGIATSLQEKLMPKGQAEAPAGPETPATASEQDSNPQSTQDDVQSMEIRLMDEITALKDVIEKSAPQDKNKELEDLKKEIEDLLKSDDK